ncbi:hypothetical protein BM528_13350 [Alteromonas sp. RW2A1]|nr:hypothetical protein BM528_13350 [Alteromonas sp. RW2A1]
MSLFITREHNMIFKYGISAAALIFMLEAIYAFFKAPGLDTHHSYLQTALLFIILGVCYEQLSKHRISRNRDKQSEGSH